MKVMGKRALAVAGMTAFAVGSVLVPASAAQAVPRECTSSYEAHQYRAYCWGGTGEFQARVQCFRAGSDTQFRWAYGTWKRTGSTDSVAVCLPSEDPSGGFAAFRG